MNEYKNEQEGAFVGVGNGVRLGFDFAAKMCGPRAVVTCPKGFGFFWPAEASYDLLWLAVACYGSLWLAAAGYKWLWLAKGWLWLAGHGSH